jgi:hypothetical protein
VTELTEIRPQLLEQLRARQQGQYRVYTSEQEGEAARTYIAGQQDLGERSRNISRFSHVMTCESWSQQGRYISMWVNPADISWQIGQRSSKQKTKAGSVLHVWRDRERGTFFDEPVLSITFQTGNIWPIRLPPPTPRENPFATSPELQPNPFPSPDAPNSDWELIVPPGLDMFYETLALIDEQKSLSDGRPNSVYIMANTKVFPQITLVGFFEPDGVSWTESPDDGAMINWTANFEVHATQPHFYDPRALRRAFLSTVPRRPAGVAAAP